MIVPAHNEAVLLPASLRAIRTAAGAASAAAGSADVQVRVVVVADACTDATVTAARAAGADVIETSVQNVGAARAAGAAFLLREAATGPGELWLATTDADTVVPAGWIARQLAYAGEGWDVVLGTVAVARWDEHPPHVPAAFRARYAFGPGPHPHVHGANFGIRASAYLAAGGFQALSSGEDHALRAAAVTSGCRVLHSADIEVVTSARRDARADNGFGSLLKELAGEGSAAP